MSDYCDIAPGHHPRSLEDWVKLFRRRFKFMGGEVVRAFLTSIGYLPDAHRRDCPVFDRLADRSPPWMAAADR